MSERFQDHFSAVAKDYADFRPHYPVALFDYLATIVPRSSLVWDCACGNGQATCDLALRYDSIMATDASKEQIASATLHPKVQYRVTPAEHSGLPDKRVGLVTVAQAVHWFDYECFYAEVKRVLLPTGVIAVWAYGLNAVAGNHVNELVHAYYTRTVGPYWPPQRRFVEEGYREIPFPFEEIKPPTFRMQARWKLDQLLGYFSTWSATGRYIKATGQDPLKPLARELKQVWGDADTPRHIAWPLSLRVGRLSIS